MKTALKCTEDIIWVVDNKFLCIYLGVDIYFVGGAHHFTITGDCTAAPSPAVSILSLSQYY